MKKIALAFAKILAVAVLYVQVVSWISSCTSETKVYCGTVVELKELSAAGSKHGRIERACVFYCPELKRNIFVKVTDNCFVNLYEGKKVCFTLTDYDLRR